MKEKAKISFKTVDKSNLDKQLKTLEEIDAKVRDLSISQYEEYVESKKNEEYAKSLFALKKHILARKILALAKTLDDFAKSESEEKLSREGRATYKCFCCFVSYQEKEYDRYFRKYKKIRLIIRSIMNSGQLPKEMERGAERYLNPKPKVEAKCKQSLLSLERQIEAEKAENTKESLV